MVYLSDDSKAMGAATIDRRCAHISRSSLFILTNVPRAREQSLVRTSDTRAVAGRFRNSKHDEEGNIGVAKARERITAEFRPPGSGALIFFGCSGVEHEVSMVNGGPSGES